MKEYDYVYGRPQGGEKYKALTEIFAARESLKSEKTSTLPLVQFWHPDGLEERVKCLNDALDIDLASGQLCFEYPTSLPPGKEYGRGKASMSDLMILMPKWRVAVEAKYTEVKDENYKPLVEEWLKDNPENRQKVLAGWKHYIGDRMTNDEKIINVTPYQLLHRIASACADPECSPCVIYHLFWDADTRAKMETFVKSLKDWVEKIELRNIRFIVATTEVLFKVSTVKLPVVELSELFLRMDEKLYGDMTNTQIVFKSDQLFIV